mmetsp:Transcript_12431/g.22459  ORF Transcript_12431/g.22459 Transcript_12431/m.22459 type:complete len:95 (+) Transcript_12431:41-325(+)
MSSVYCRMVGRQVGLVRVARSRIECRSVFVGTFKMTSPSSFTNLNPSFAVNSRTISSGSLYIHSNSNSSVHACSVNYQGIGLSLATSLIDDDVT